jgi:hypothetical protein
VRGSGERKREEKREGAGIGKTRIDGPLWAEMARRVLMLDSQRLVLELHSIVH